MKVSQLLEQTRRQHGGDSELPSYGMLERAGYIRQLSSGIFTVLHLGHRCLSKIESILREEMERIGGVEISMPLVHPAEIWQRTGRYESIDASLVRFCDRKERKLVLAMTHEEVVAHLSSGEISSYKHLPKLVFQIQTKFRDELRPRGGLIRTREFTMKDSYSLDMDEEGLRVQYARHYDAYYKMFARMGLPVVSVLSDVGMMGGAMAHEYMYLSENGEDTLFMCDKCGYRANKEIATYRKTKVASSETGDAPAAETVSTPGASTIENLAKFLDCDKDALGKMVFVVGNRPGEEETKVIAAVVRGSRSLNLIKLSALIGYTDFRPASEAEVSAVGCKAGFASPVGIDRDLAIVVVDDSVVGVPLVLGANVRDEHTRNLCCERDYKADFSGDIDSAYSGAPCKDCEGSLDAVRGIEVGNIFQLGTRYSEALDLKFVDADGKTRPVIMGSYGIGVGRALACLAEEYMDDSGLDLPISIVPYEVSLISVGGDDEVTKLAADLHQRFGEKGLGVLYDDRPDSQASAGVKFKDSDLRGIPIVVTVSNRSLQRGGVEIKRRGEREGQVVPPTEALAVASEIVDQLRSELVRRLERLPCWATEMAGASC